jgi:DNA-binding SARP family transcriptional activator
MARLEIALLGRLHVTCDGQAVADLGYDKVRALLAYLTVERHRPHERSALAALFWPDAGASVARKNLRNALATLRQAIGDSTAEPPFLLITRDSVQFNPLADAQSDMTRFDALLAAGGQHHHPNDLLCTMCARHFQQAIELYRGDFLDQVVVPHSLAWEEWVLLMRERLHRQMLDALDQIVAYQESCGEDAAARQYAWRALALEPWDEGMHRSLMRVLARGGQRSAALVQYNRCQRILAQELGVEPAAETTVLYQAIRAGRLEKPVGGARHAQVPASFDPGADSPLDVPQDTAVSTGRSRATSSTPLNGQAAAVALHAALAQWPDAQVLMLADLPCGGTIRFGLMLAKTPQDDVADGVCFVALAPVRNPALIAAALAQVSSAQETAHRTLAMRLQEYLRDKALRLVLDNFERVLASTVELGQ